MFLRADITLSKLEIFVLSLRLWKTVNTLLHRKSSSPLPTSTPGSSLADSFANFFRDKISKLRISLTAILLLHPHTYPPLQLNLPVFLLSGLHLSRKLSKILFNCPNKQSDSDPIPTWLLKICASVLTPIITNIVNLSLSSSQFHPILKESVISPLLKKPTL